MLPASGICGYRCLTPPLCSLCCWPVEFEITNVLPPGDVFCSPFWCGYCFVWLHGFCCRAFDRLDLAFLLVLMFFQSFLAFSSPCLGKRELAFVLLVQLYLCLVCVPFCLFPFLLMSRVGCGLWLWRFLAFCALIF